MAITAPNTSTTRTSQQTAKGRISTSALAIHFRRLWESN